MWRLLVIGLAAASLGGCHLALPYASTAGADRGADGGADRGRDARAAPRDAAGERAPGPDGTCSRVQRVFAAVADSYADESAPDQPLGEVRSTLSAGRYFEQHAYLAFDTSAVPVDVDALELELYVENPSQDGPLVRRLALPFAEDALTWDGRPADPGVAVADIGAASTGWLTIPMIALAPIPRPTLVLALVPHTTKGLDLHAREGANPPRIAASGSRWSAVADTFVDSRVPATPHGSHTLLQTDWQPNTIAYLKFDVQGLAGEVTGAWLELYAFNCGDPVAIHAAAADWDEATLTWNDRPAPAPSPLGTLPCTPGVRSRGPVSVVGDGAYAFAVLPTSAGEKMLVSAREDSDPPQLVVELQACGGPADAGP